MELISFGLFLYFLLKERFLSSLMFLIILIVVGLIKLGKEGYFDEKGDKLG